MRHQPFQGRSMSRNNEVQALVVLKILWGALFISQFMFGFVLQTVLIQGEAAAETNDTILPIIVSFAFVSWILGFILPRFMLKQKKTHADINSPDIAQLATNYQVPFILRLALFESAAIYGFALAFMYKDIKYFVPFLAVNVVLWIMNFPSDENIRKAFKNI